MSVDDALEILSGGEEKAETMTPGVPVICPTCGASRGGATGAPHGCSTVATMPSKSGTGVVYAPMAAEAKCELCGQKKHRNLVNYEQNLLCLWQQFSNDCYSGVYVKKDRFGVETQFADVNPPLIEDFSRWIKSGAFRVRTRKTRTLRVPKMSPTVPIKPVTFSAPPVHVEPIEITPEMSRAERSIAADINEHPPEVKASKKTRAQIKADLVAEMKRQEREDKGR